MVWGKTTTEAENAKLYPEFMRALLILWSSLEYNLINASWQKLFRDLPRGLSSRKPMTKVPIVSTTMEILINLIKVKHGIVSDIKYLVIYGVNYIFVAYGQHLSENMQAWSLIKNKTS